jgi:hypothetical protein
LFRSEFETREAEMATITSPKMIITVDVKTHTIDSVKNASGTTIPEVGTEGIEVSPPPPGGYGQVALIKWHHHSPYCITLDIAGGGQYEVCFDDGT